MQQIVDEVIMRFIHTFYSQLTFQIFNFMNTLETMGIVFVGGYLTAGGAHTFSPVDDDDDGRRSCDDDDGSGGDGSNDGAQSDTDGSDRAEEEERYLSKSTYGSSRSALVHLYRSCGAVMPDDFREDMANFIRGIKRKVATQKQATGIRAEEGKAVMPFDC